MKINDIVAEGVHDPGIFKAVFFIGGPGSGKTYVGGKLALNTLGLVNIDSDVLLTLMMVKADLDLKMPPEEQPERDAVRARAKELTNKKRTTLIDGRLGLQVQGTGYDFGKMDKVRQGLEDIGYETALVVVNVDLETSLARNVSRGDEGGRTVDPAIVREKWHQTQANIDQFLEAFPRHFVINNSPSNDNLESDLNNVHKRLAIWSKQLPKNEAVQAWLQTQPPR